MQDLIFDSSQPQALPLTKDHLDDCCSTPLRKVTFVSIFQARCFIKRHMVHRRLFLKALYQMTAADLEDTAQAALLKLINEDETAPFLHVSTVGGALHKIFRNPTYNIIKIFANSQMKMLTLSSGF